MCSEGEPRAGTRREWKGEGGKRDARYQTLVEGLVDGVLYVLLGEGTDGLANDLSILEV